jgi:cytoskeleton protein RodZ
MNDPIWRTEDGQLLKDLRMSAGMGMPEFSRAASISIAQLRQLEEGGNELFYSQTIKFQMGRKLLIKLGADVVRVADQSVAQTSALMDPSSEPATSGTQKKSHPMGPKPVLPEPKMSLHAGHKRWALALSAVAILLVAMVFGPPLWSTKNDGQPLTSQATTPEQTQAALVPATTESLSQPNESAIPLTPQEPPALTQATPPQDSPPPTPVSACSSSQASGKIFVPMGMDKPSNYIHFVANTDVNICVEDGAQKISALSMKAGEKRTVRGRAPWRVQSAHWADISVYFQGYRIPVSATADWVVLKPRTEPLTEPTAQSN